MGERAGDKFCSDKLGADLSWRQVQEVALQTCCRASYDTMRHLQHRLHCTLQQALPVSAFCQKACAPARIQADSRMRSDALRVNGDTVCGAQALAQEVACYLGLDLSPIKIKRFADGEIYVQVQVRAIPPLSLSGGLNARALRGGLQFVGWFRAQSPSSRDKMCRQIRCNAT